VSIAHAQFMANYRNNLQLIWGNIAHALHVAIKPVKAAGNDFFKVLFGQIRLV
jgi:hypothetical protein